MGWPEGNEWGSTSYTCNSNGISGTMQHFTNGKVYLSKIATVFVPWSDWNWINHYENVEGFNNLGWPRTEKIRENNKERMYFEKGYLEYRNVILGSPITFVDLNCSFVNLSVLEEVRQHLKTAGYENLEDSPAKFTKAIELLIQDFRHLIDNPQDIPGVIVNMVVGVVEGFVDNMITDFLSLIGMTFQMAVDFINNPDVSSKLQNILDSIRSVDILSLAISFLGGNLDEYISTDIYGRSRLVGRMILNILMLVFPVGIVVKALSVTDDLARMMVRVIDTLSNSTKLVKVNNLNKLLTKFKGIIGNSDDLWKVYNNAVYYVNKGIDIYPDVDYVWLSRIDGDISRLEKKYAESISEVLKNINTSKIDIDDEAIKIIINNRFYDISDRTSQEIYDQIARSNKFVKAVEVQTRISNLIETKDLNYLSKVSEKVGVSVAELQQMQHLTQVQILMPNGRYIVADDVWVKRISDKNFDIIINETKLHAGVQFTTNQQMFKEYVDSGVRQFTLRSEKFIPYGLRQNTNLRLIGILRTNGDNNIDGYSVINF